MKIKTHKQRFKLNRKNSFQMIMLKDTNKIIRKQFISSKSFPYTFEETWRKLNSSQIKTLKPINKI
jgi:hypothetical protein